MAYTHGRRWSNEQIEKEIIETLKALNINRMPSRVEIEGVTGNSALTNKIAKTGGFRMWAEKLNLELKECETSFGNDYEFIVKEILEEVGYDVEKMTTKHPYDLLVNDNIKIDVKVSRYYKGDGYKYHTYNLEKKYHNCDIFILVGVNEDEDIEKLLVIPGKYVMNKKQISVGVKSMYDRFDKDFSYIDKYIDFYNSL